MKVSKQTLKAWAPLVLALVVLCFSFFHGWYFDQSKKQGGAGWADQETYTSTVETLASGELPTTWQLHFAIGYPALGVAGHLVSSEDPFMAVSLVLLLTSATFCFLAVRHLLGTVWALLFSFLLFYWDGVARTLHFSSEIFAVPWNNQVLFFVFAFYFWLFVTQLKKPPGWKLLVATGIISGLCFVTREESILFIAPALTGFFWLTKSNWKQWLLVFGIVGVCFLPQLAVKYHTLGSVTESGHDAGYSQTLDKYLQPQQLYDNTWEVLIDSNHFNGPKNVRKALFQAAPWLWLAPIGLLIVLISKRYPKGLKVFTILSLWLLVFYLSGSNMSAQKLQFHCLRYIAPAFIALNFGVIVVLYEVYRYGKKLVTGETQLPKSVRRIAKVTEKILMVAPLVIPAALAGFSVVVVSLLLFGQLKSIYVWPLGLLAAALAAWPVIRTYKYKPERRKELLICNVLVLLGVVAWVAFNGLYTAQHVFTNRDPGVYAVGATYLTERDNLRLEASETFGEVTGVEVYSGGFAPNPRDTSEIQVQGAHLLPSLLGIGGRIVGTVHLFRLNVIIGGLALLAIYGFARQLLRPAWAACVVAAMAATLPMIYFSRDTFTEPLAALFTFGGLALVIQAQKLKNKWLWLVAGLVVGSAVLTRIDGFLAIASVITFAIIILALSKKSERKYKLVEAAFLATGMALPAVVGYLDIWQLSYSYFLSEWSNIRTELLAITALLVVAVPLVMLAWRTNLLKRLDASTKRWRMPVSIGAVVAAGILLASRPLWYTSYVSRNTFVDGQIQQVYQRDFAELTVLWLAWYIGPLLVGLSLWGISLAIKRLFEKKDLLLLAPLITIVGTALFYLSYPSIFPDQIWASRRLLPVIMPGLVFFGFFALEWLYRQKKLLTISVNGAVLAAVIATLAIIGPLVVSKPFLRTREATWYQPVEAVCNQLPQNATVLWVGKARTQLIEPTKALCNVPAAGYGVLFGQSEGLEPEILAEVARNARRMGYVPIVGSFSNENPPIVTESEVTTVSTYSYSLLESTHTSPPRKTLTFTDSIQLGIIQNDGTITPLNE